MEYCLTELTLFVSPSYPVIKLLKILEKVNVKPRKDAFSVYYCDFNYSETSVLKEILITSGSIFSRGISLRA